MVGVRHVSSRSPHRVSHARAPLRLRSLVVFLVSSLGFPMAASAHAIHSTLTEVTHAVDGTVTVKIRSFADDLATAVSKASGAGVRPDYRVLDSDLARYVGASFSLSVGGQAIPLTFTAQRRSAEVVWIELKGRAPSLSGARVFNTMLFDLHADQVNVVKATYASRTFTTLFARGGVARSLP